MDNTNNPVQQTSPIQNSSENQFSNNITNTNSKKNLLIVIGVILVIVIVGAGMYVLGARKNQSLIESSSQKQLTPTQSPQNNISTKMEKILMQEGTTGAANSTFSIYDMTTKQKNTFISSDVEPNEQEGPNLLISPNKKYLGIITDKGVSNPKQSDLYVYSLIDYSSKKLASDLIPLPFDINFTNGMYVHSSLAWSPDSRRIVFLSGVNRKPELWVTDIDGINLKQITNDGTIKVNLQWSPDGKKILYRTLGVDNLTANTYVYNVDTGSNSALNAGTNSTLQRLFQEDANFRLPFTWLDSDTLLIAVPSFSTTQKADLQGLWLLTVSTMQVKRVVAKPLSPNDVLYISPDKKRIVFITNDEKAGVAGASYGSWLSNLDGTGLTNLGERIDSVNWSPDNSSFAYEGFSDKGITGLWIYNIANKTPNKIVSLDGMKYTVLSNIVWSPDSKKLLYKDTVMMGMGSVTDVPKDENDKQGVWIVGYDGTGLQKVIDSGLPILWLQ